MSDVTSGHSYSPRGGSRAGTVHQPSLGGVTMESRGAAPGQRLHSERRRQVYFRFPHWLPQWFPLSLVHNFSVAGGNISASVQGSSR